VVDSTWLWREALARLLENAGHDLVPLPAAQASGPAQISNAWLAEVDAAILSLDDRGDEMLRVLRNADIPCLVLGIESSSEVAIAIQTGSSYASKQDITLPDLFRLLEAAASGNAMILRASQRVLAETFEIGRADILMRGADLTSRESQVLEGIGRGLSNRDIAAELFLAPSTVKKIVSRCLQKLGVEIGLRPPCCSAPARPDQQIETAGA
jgi:DNA-binding NarL/FixJ family response regulator